MTRAIRLLRRRPVLVAALTLALALIGIALPPEQMDALVQLLLILLDAAGGG